MPKDFEVALDEAVKIIGKLENVKIPFSLKVAEYINKDESILDDLRREFNLTNEFNVHADRMDTIVNDEWKQILWQNLSEFNIELKNEFKETSNQNIKDWYTDSTTEAVKQAAFWGWVGLGGAKTAASKLMLAGLWATNLTGILRRRSNN